MRFHLIDRIDEYEPRRSVRGRTVVSAASPAVVDLGDGPVLPPPLVLEAICQAGTWLIMLSTERRKRAALLQIGGVRFVGDARPGDVVIVDGVVESMNDETAVLSGTARVAGKPVVEATDIMCALIDADDLEAPEDSERMLRQLTGA
ncbi:hotdog family protein [Jiangella endophytica]|uniref:3-hydroxylacyl-ACP dehydratase n=1 Tax=Jiangella endophytica TaxID=1623398 RepID=UPI000E345E43|nr:3-hydroxylacyl-ACP dehydratase [Jiangella endophytica]